MASICFLFQIICPACAIIHSTLLSTELLVRCSRRPLRSGVRPIPLASAGQRAEQLWSGVRGRIHSCPLELLPAHLPLLSVDSSALSATFPDPLPRPTLHPYSAFRIDVTSFVSVSSAKLSFLCRSPLVRQWACLRSALASAPAVPFQRPNPPEL